VGALVLALVTVVSGVLSFAAPSEIRFAEVSGQGQPNEPGLTLASVTPAVLEVSIPAGAPCDTLLFSTMADPLSPTGLSVWSETDCSFRITSPQNPTAPIPERRIAAGDLTLRYESSGGKGRVRVDSSSTSPLEWEVSATNLDGIYASAQTAWSLKTHATGSTPSGQGKALSVIALGSFGILLISLLTLVTKNLLPRSWPRFAVNPRLVVAAAVLGAGSLLLPPNFDDGWLLAEAKMRSVYGWFSTYFEDYSVPNPTGYWWQAITAQVWAQVPDSYATMRLLTSAVLWIVVWWLCERCMRSLELSVGARWLGLAAFLAMVLGTGLTLRQESFVALALAVVLVMGVQAYRAPLLAATVSATAGGVALATHQTGWVVALPAAVLVVRELVRAESRRWLFIMLPGSLFAAALAALLALDSSMSVALQSTAALSSGDLHDKTPFDEYLRVFDVLAKPAASRFALVCLVIAVVMIIAASLNRESGTRVVDTLLLTGSGIAGLMLTNSKWSAHYASVAPAVALALAVTAFLVMTTPKRRGVLVLGATFFAVWALVGQTRFGVEAWQTAWLVNDLQSSSLAGIQRAGAVLLLLFAVLWAILWGASRGRAVTTGVTVTAMMIVALIPALTAMLALGRDGLRTQDQWTQTGALWGKGPECGIVSEAPFATVAPSSLRLRALPSSGVQENSRLEGSGPTLALWVSQDVSTEGSIRVEQRGREAVLVRSADPAATYEMWSSPVPSWFDRDLPSRTFVAGAGKGTQLTNPLLTEVRGWDSGPLPALAPPYLYIQALCLQPIPLIADALTDPALSFSLDNNEAPWWLNTRITTNSPTFSLGAHERVPMRVRMVLPTPVAQQLQLRRCKTPWFSIAWQDDCP